MAGTGSRATSIVGQLSLICFLAAGMHAQDLPPLASPPEPGTGKLARPIAELIAAQDSEEKRRKIARSHRAALRDDRLAIEIHLKRGATWRPELYRSLYSVETVFQDAENRLVWARVPLGRIRALADDLDEVAFIRTPPSPVPDEVLTEGLGLTGTLGNYHALGYKGQGVKVAIIDLGFDGLEDAKANGELPQDVITQDFSGEGLGIGADGEPEPHGAGVAEIVHDMTPEAELHLLKVDTGQQLAKAVDYAIANGIKVVNHSVAYFGTSFYDGRGVISEQVSRAARNGILWVNSAGNHALSHYQDIFFDSDNDGWQNFQGEDETVNVNLKGGKEYTFWLTWSAWNSRDGDYDLYLLDDKLDSDKAVGKTEPLAPGSQVPAKELVVTVPEDGDYHLCIRRTGGTKGHVLALFSHPVDLSEHNTLERSIPDPAVSEHALAVAAVPQAWWPDGPLEDFSSRGPTNGGLVKPDLAGPDGVSNLTLGSFFGTSAAAPHVAGAAAVLLSRFPELSVTDLRIQLEANAIDAGQPGKDNLYGAGSVNLPAGWSRPEPRLRLGLSITPLGPHYIDQEVTGTFEIRNAGTGCMSFRTLAIGGRDPSGAGADFTHASNITLCGGQTYGYTGTLKFAKAGRHHFFATYQVTDGTWNTSVAAESGTNVLDIDVLVAPQPQFAAAGVVNAASYAGGAVAPGELVTVFGSYLGSDSFEYLKVNAQGLLENRLGDTRVLFDGVPAPLIYVTAGQLSAVVPYTVAGRSQTVVQVERRGVLSVPVVMPVAGSMPGVFTLDASGAGPGAVLNENYSINSFFNPAPAGSIVMIYATGEGQTNPPGVDGLVTGAVLRRPVLPVEARIGGQSAEVLYAGSAPGIVSGVFQVNARIAADAQPESHSPLELLVGGRRSQQGVTIAVAPPGGVQSLLYGIDSGSGDRSSTLVQIDPQTGVANKIGETGLAPIADLAFTPDGEIYGIYREEGFFSQRDYLVRIDPLTGSAQVVGPLGYDRTPALAAGADGKLYAASADGEFLRVDKTTGAASLIGPLGAGYIASGDLAFNAGGALFATVSSDDSDWLVLVDKHSGWAWPIGPTGFREVFGLAFTPGGKLLGAADGDSDVATLIEIDPYTGAGRYLTDIRNAQGMYGLSIGTRGLALPRPDLVVTSFSAPGTGTIGGRLPRVEVQIENRGRASAGPFRLGFYVSADASITLADVFTTWHCLYDSGLAASAATSCTGEIGIPSRLSPGLYYLGVIIDDLGQADEADESNNTRMADTGRIALSSGG